MASPPPPLPVPSMAASLLNSSNFKGVLLAVVSSAFIGSSFIIKKKGLKKAGASGPRASVGGYGYLLEPLWWMGMVTMIVGEIANFVAYVFAPATLVTPLGALSIIVSAVLAHFLLNEKLQKMGMLGCLLCIVGSVVIVLHASDESSLASVEEIWELAIQPAFLLYTASAIAVSLVLILYCAPRYGQTNILVYIGICSIIGSLTVMSIKAVGIAIELTLEGTNQFKYFQAWVFLMVSVTCIMTQLNYLNMVNIARLNKEEDWRCTSIFQTHVACQGRLYTLIIDGGSCSNLALEELIEKLNLKTEEHLNPYQIAWVNETSILALDTFNTAVVSPIYYALFTSFTILASVIMFKDWSGLSASSIVSELCGFITVLSGTAILHSTREPDPPFITDLYTPLSPKVSWHIQGNGEIWKPKDEDGPDFVAILRQDYFK